MRQPLALTARLAAFAARETPSLASGAAVLAVSGGADSIATAALLCEAGVVDPRASTVAHFDHALRGPAAAARDRDAVEALCDRLGFTLVAATWPDPQPGEAAARNARYAFLRESARAAGLDVVVTGHTADDQAETVLMHALRGAGLHGLAGMLPEVTREGITIARPALCLARAETRGFCQAAGLTFHDDPTNDDRRHLRSRLRRDAFPSASGPRAELTASLVSLAASARAAARQLDGLAGTAIIERRPDSVRMSRRALRTLGPVAAAHALRLAAIAVLGEARELDRRHYRAFARAALDGRTGSTVELPRGLAVTVDAAEAILHRRGAVAPMIERGFAATLPFTGDVGGWHVSAVAATAAGERTVLLPRDVRLRRRAPGDRIRLPGGTKKLQDLFVDLKVPRRERDATPVIAAGSDVCWTPYRHAAVGDGTPWRIDAARLPA